MASKFTIRGGGLGTGKDIGITKKKKRTSNTDDTNADNSVVIEEYKEPTEIKISIEDSEKFFRAADEQKQQGVHKRSGKQIPKLCAARKHRQIHTPPHHDLSEIVRMPRVFPYPGADDFCPIPAAFLKLVHLHVGSHL